ncbi:hypothetical protein FSP39_015835 [Pinctada imbricata]|uniref:Uncharacterized protein n=1 Tax=Pinctada imbricata TaxID=66713 RepID=A0AA89C4Z6_PINIB|nr:hypothetical protein FSP39_015835 [Pinctada imbricata]
MEWGLQRNLVVAVMHTASRRPPPPIPRGHRMVEKVDDPCTSAAKRGLFPKLNKIKDTATRTGFGKQSTSKWSLSNLQTLVESEKSSKCSTDENVTFETRVWCMEIRLEFSSRRTKKGISNNTGLLDLQQNPKTPNEKTQSRQAQQETQKGQGTLTHNTETSNTKDYI